VQRRSPGRIPTPSPPRILRCGRRHEQRRDHLRLSTPIDEASFTKITPDVERAPGLLVVLEILLVA